MSQLRQHGGPGLLGSDPSSQRPPQLPRPRTRAPDEPSSSQPPAQVQAPVPVTLPPENKDLSPPPPAASLSPSSHAMIPPVSDPVKNSHVNVSMTAGANMDDAQDDELVGSSGSSIAATDKKRLLKLNPPAPMKNSDVDVSMARRDDQGGQGDILGLNVYMAKKKRMLSTKASYLPVDAVAEEEATAARKKTRLGWGQGLAKYEHCQFKKDADEMTHKTVAHDDGTTREDASSHGSPAPATGDIGDSEKNGSISKSTEKVVSPAKVPGRFSHKHRPSPDGSKGHGDNKSLDDMAETRVSRVTTAPALSCKGSSRPLNTGDLDSPRKNDGSISSLTEKAVPPTELPSRFSPKHNPSPAGGILDSGSIFPTVSVPRKEDRSISSSSMTAIAAPEIASSSQGRDALPDESSMKFTKVEDIPPRKEKVIVKIARKPRNILKTNVLSDEELETNELQGSKLKEWSQEEKDVFSEMITAFGMNFPKVSSFLRHKTPTDCMQYYFEHYKSECHKEAEKCLPSTVMQSQENSCNENDAAHDKVKGKEGNNPVFCVASKHGSGIQLSCEVNSQEIEKVDSIPSPEGSGHNADKENPTKDSSPCAVTNAAVVNDDLIQQRASDAMASQKGKGILLGPDGNNYYAPPVYIANEASKTYHLPSSSSCAALDIVHATSSYIAMDIDLNIPLDVTSVDLGNSNAAAFMGRSSEATESDSDATMEIISPSHTTATVPQTSQQQSANQPGSIMLFGQVIYQAPSTGTTNHTPNQQVNQTVVPVRRTGGQVYPSSWATTTSVRGSSVPKNQQVQQAVLSNRMPYAGSTNGASSSAASPLQLEPQSSSALANLIQQRRQQALVNITPNIILGGGVPIVPSHLSLIQGSSGGAGLLTFNNGFNSAPGHWTYPVMDTSRVVVDTSRVVIGHPFYYPGTNANQAPATAITLASIAINNGEGASTSNARASPPEGRGRGRNPTWLSLHRN